MDYKKSKAPSNTVTRDVQELWKDTGNIYESVAIIAGNAVTVGFNLPSKTQGSKDIIKISGVWLDIKDLKVGQKLEGVVRNVVDFGAFVDIGIHEDGLIHISHMSKKFIKHPSQVVSVGDLVTVWVKKIDVQREKVNLSLLAPDESN